MQPHRDRAGEEEAAAQGGERPDGANGTSREGAAPSWAGGGQQILFNHFGQFSCQHRLPQIEQRTDWDDK